MGPESYPEWQRHDSWRTMARPPQPPWLIPAASETIGDRVFRLMQQQRMTVPTLARLAGIKDASSLLHLFSGKTRAPAAGTAIRLAEALGVTPQFLVFGQESEASLKAQELQPYQLIRQHVMEILRLVNQLEHAAGSPYPARAEHDVPDLLAAERRTRLESAGLPTQEELELRQRGEALANQLALEAQAIAARYEAADARKPSAPGDTSRAGRPRPSPRSNPQTETPDK